ncbi:farnesol dehydrogenase-like [Haematobia irritans]|uniref:farnesol dehydrogenase-like n=1 Tax=Haematobia irritans TaxID=7368 RepID=UPI003F500DD5
MDRWQNKVAVVTGASSGIGAAIVYSLLKNDLQVVGLARHMDRMDEMKNKLPIELQQKFTGIECNVSQMESVDMAFDEVVSKYGGVDVLVNSAGNMNYNLLLTGDISSIQETLQTNVMGVVHCNQRAFKSMRERNFNGHIFILNSIVGHCLPIFPKEIPPEVSMYVASKCTLTAMTEMYRQELRHLNTKIKITSISPGIVDTGFIEGFVRQCSEGNLLHPDDVASAVLYALSTPPNVQIHELKIKPMDESVI